jgi:hypothetical protein
VQENVRIPYATGYKVLHEVQGIVKRVPPEKLKLSLEQEQYRVIFCNWALGRLQCQAIFIFTDEMAVQSDRHRKRQKVSIKKGSNKFEHARPPANTFRTVMFWGAICEGYRPGPFHIWEQEKQAETTHLKEVMATNNRRAANVVSMERELARAPGTHEFQVLQELNTNVRQRDQDDPLPSSYPRRSRLPQWEFKFEKEDRGDKMKGGIDWLRYRETILYPKLYPWAMEIHEATGREVYIIEDNAPPHAKAKRLSVNRRVELACINVVDWPTQSPDLNKIERI